MKKLLAKLSLLCAFSSAFAATPAYVALYGLTIDSTLLSNTLQQNNHVNAIDAGFLLLKAQASCNIQNISDGSPNNPLASSHVADIQKFVSNGGSFGLIIGGSLGTSGTVADPLSECNQTDLVNLIEQSISTTGTTVDRINFDIETNFFNLDANYWNKINSTIAQLSINHPNMKFVLSIPEYSSYWSQGYTPQMKNFFANLPSNTSVNIMMSQTGGDSQSTQYAEETIKALNISSSNATIMVDPSDDSNGNPFTDYAGTTYLLNGASGSVDQTMLQYYKANNN